MDLNLKNKKALITGSSRGIGYSIAKKLSEEGCEIALNSRNKRSLDIAAESIPNSIPIIGDVTQEKDSINIVNEFKKNFGDIDILICNVGSGKSVFPGNENLNEWKRMFEINFWSATNIIESSKENLVKTKGSIVCISSICGLETIDNAPLTYSTAKAALNSYVKGLSRVLGKDGVRINAIAPGNILFEGSTWSKRIADDKKSTYEMIRDKVPLNRFGSVEDVANMACFLSSSLSSNVTGTIFSTDGGQCHN